MVAILLLIAQPVTADTYALVIGIDAYKNYGSLDGAVNDAKVVADSFKKMGIHQIKLLLNDKATRAEIKKAWDELSAEAKAGDTIYFTYAGHGAQSPERVKGTEEDGLDEFYVLANFNESGVGTSERIIDDDLQEWFSTRPDLNIILVSDSCHSGTMTRAYKKTSKLKYRKIDITAITDDVLPVSEHPDIIDERKNKMAHVISVSGVPDNEEVPEVRIENKPHGALSWYLSKGLIGIEADENKDGTVSLSEMKNYLIEKVRMATDGQQHPQIAFVNDLPIIQGIKTNQNAQDLNSAVNMIKTPFSIDSKNESFKKNVLKSLTGIQLVTAEQSLLEWDVDNRVIRNQFNDIVYNFSTKTSNEPLTRKIQTDVLATQATINKFRLVEALKLLSDGSLELKLLPNDKLHTKGESVSFEVNRLKYPYFTLINLAVDGRIQFLYPSQPQDTLNIPINMPYKLDLEVSEPFGADHFVVIVSDKPLLSLHEALKKLNNGNSLVELRKVLNSALKDTKYQLGIHASFTAATL
jgi:uncharacterized caspase-like protein